MEMHEWFFSFPVKCTWKKPGYTIHIYLVDIVHSGESVKLQVHGVKHMNDLNGFTHGTDIGKRHYITEQYGAFLEFSCRTHTHKLRCKTATSDRPKQIIQYLYLLTIY